jgi:hypothetical protein
MIVLHDWFPPFAGAVINVPIRNLLDLVSVWSQSSSSRLLSDDLFKIAHGATLAAKNLMDASKK